MQVKGTAFLARKALLGEQIGEDVWNAFVAEIGETIPIFADPIVAVTNIPVHDFLAFTDALVERFFDGDPQAHWRLGVASADWALTDGPYAVFFETRDIAGFLRTGPHLWRAYYSAGVFAGTLDQARGIVDVKITGLDVKHVHFELNVMGYIKRGLELVGAKVKEVQPVLGFSQGDPEVHYRFVLEQQEDDRF